MSIESPQLSDGYTPIANPIVDALASARLSGHEWCILMALLRKTYGWSKKSDIISLSQFVNATGIRKAHVVETIQRLVLRNMIHKTVTEIGNTTACRYEFNKCFGEWRPLPKSGTFPKSGTKPFPKSGHTITRKDTTSIKNPPTPQKAKVRKPTTYSCTFDYDAGSWVMTDVARAKLEHDWPDVDMEVELKKAAAWALDHASKPVKNGLSFLSRWFAKPDCQRKPGVGIEQDFYGTKYRISYDSQTKPVNRPVEKTTEKRTVLPESVKEAMKKMTQWKEEDDE